MKKENRRAQYDKMIFARNLARIIEAKGMSGAELSRAVGVSKTTVSEWLAGKKAARWDNMEALCGILGVKMSNLIEDLPQPDNQSDPFPSEQLIPFPIIGNIAAGYDGQAVEELTGEIEYIPASMLNGYSREDFFVLRVKGDSMYPKLVDGDRVLVQRVPSVDSGRTAVMLYNEEDATVKRVNYIYGEDWLELIPANPEYKPKRIEGRDLEQCRILGKVVKLIRDID